MFVNGEKVIKVLESIAPPHLAEDWDNCGLILGSTSREVSKILVALEINEAVVSEAVAKSVDLIVTHHPLIFKAIKKINDLDPIGKLLLKLAKQGISVYSCHTNLDIATGGTNDYLASRFSLKKVRPLTVEKTPTCYKLIVFTPTTHTDAVRKVMSDQGAGQIGNYSDCAFVSNGIGMFKPQSGAQPFLGTVDVLEQVSEDKLEFIVQQSCIKSVISAMLQAHPYEVPAYDLIKLENEVASFGFGRVGELANAATMGDFLQEVKSILGLDEIRFNGRTGDMVKTVALCSGAGADFLEVASKNGVDLYLTGDIKHHDYRDAEMLGLNIADMGHFESENIYMSVLKEKLEAQFEQKDYDVKIVLSETLKPSFNTF